MTLDLHALARKLTDAADRCAEAKVSVSNFELIISRDGHGTGRSESVPFALLFLSDQDVLGDALTRLGLPGRRDASTS